MKRYFASHCREAFSSKPSVGLRVIPALLGALLGCSGGPAPSQTAASPVVRSPGLLAAQDEASLDVTITIGADVEIGMTGRGMTEVIARNHALAMRELHDPASGARLKWPAGTSSPGANIAGSAGVFIAGDLAADRSISPGSPAWVLLRELYVGPNPAVGALAYLGAGNHDTDSHNWWFTIASAANNNNVYSLVRETKQDVFSTFEHNFGPFSSTPAHYAVLKSRLLVVHLATSLGEPCRKAWLIDGGRYNLGYYGEPSDAECPAQEWLRATLLKHRSEQGAKAPVIIVQHYGYDSFGVSGGGYRGYWWHPDARDALADIIKDSNVIGFFHGHTHTDGFTPKGTKYMDQPVFRDEATSPKLDVGHGSGGRMWTDVDGDGYPDYCRVVGRNDYGAGKVSCRRYTQAGFADKDIVSGELDVGFSQGRAFADFDGDKKADYCRVVGANNGTGKVRCALSTGTGFGAEITSGNLDVGYFEGRAFADVNGDGKVDYCRVVDANNGTGKVRCALSTGTGFGADITSDKLEVGYFEGRSFADVNGDGKADYCRVVDANNGTGKVRCALSTGTGFGPDITSGNLDVGFFEGRSFADVNGDKKADYCRITDYNHAIGVVRCTLSTGEAFDKEITSDASSPKTAGIDVGYGPGRAFADFNGDGKADYCRVVLSRNNLECTISSDSGFSFESSVRSLPVTSAGESRTWVDINKDGRTDFCRTIDASSGEGRVACTLAAGATTVVPVDSYSVASGYSSWQGRPGGFTLVRVTDSSLDVVPVHKTSANASPGYDGSVAVNASLVRSVPIVTH